MMKYQIFLAVCLFFFSCQSNENSQAADETSQPKPGQEITKSTAVQPETFCYRRTVGEDPNRQDVWYAKLTVEGHKVKGIYNWIPFEKDSGRGLFLGVMDGGIVTGVWNCAMGDSYRKEEVIFKLSDTELRQKSGQLEEKEGVLRMKNPEAAVWEEAMLRVDCEG